MDFIGLILFGVLLNLVFILISSKAKLHVRGIDSISSIPIVAGFMLGAWSGAAAGVILSATYHMMRPSTLGSLPLTFLCSVIAGLLGALLAFMPFLAAGILILFIYHVMSLALMLVLSQPSPGYITFIVLNFTTSIILLIITGGILGL